MTLLVSYETASVCKQRLLIDIVHMNVRLALKSASLLETLA